VSGTIRDETPTEPITPETYLGSDRLERFVGSPLVKGREASYRIPRIVPQNDVAYGGRWTIERERIVAGEDARLRLAFHARKVFLVLGDGTRTQTVGVHLDGHLVKTVHVTGDRLYTLVELHGRARDHTLDLSFTPGTEAYAFTFG
jgi:hypothetical protein